MAEAPIRRFKLVRHEDETGVSGVGIVAYGIKFGDGVCVLRWATGTASTNVYDSLADLEAIHGHAGKTTVEWID